MSRERTEQIFSKLTPEDHGRLVKLAKRNGRSMAREIEQAVKAWMREQERKVRL